MTDTTINQADNTQTAAGQMFPEDYANEFAVISFIVRQALAEMETCTPVQVKTVHAGSGNPAAGGTVDVQLLVSLLDGNGNATKQGVVYGLPYFRMQSQNWAIAMDPAAGDYGFIIAASRDISNVTKTPGQANPGSFRQHSFSDGFFIPCSFNTATPGGYIQLKSDGSLNINTKDGVVIKSDGSGALTITTQGNATVNCGSNTLDVTATTTTIHGDLNVTGDVKAKSGGATFVRLSTHTHPGNNLSPNPGT